MSRFVLTMSCPNCKTQLTAPSDAAIGKLGCQKCDYMLDLAPVINSIGDMLDGVKNKGRPVQDDVPSGDWDLGHARRANYFVRTEVVEGTEPSLDPNRPSIQIMDFKNPLCDAPMEGLEEAAPRRAPELLREAAEVYEKRNKLYGDSYRQFGLMMEAMFPNGLWVNTIDGFNRLGIFNMMASKMMRYAANLATGGHDDSARDLIAYSAMLQELTNEGNGG